MYYGIAFHYIATRTSKECYFFYLILLIQEDFC